MHVCSASFVGEGEDQITFTALTVIIARTDVVSPMAMISLTHTFFIPCRVTTYNSNRALYGIKKVTSKETSNKMTVHVYIEQKDKFRAL